MVSSLFNLLLFVGTEWVLWVMVVLSLIGVAVFLERWRHIQAQEKVGRVFWARQISSWLVDGVPENWNQLAEEYVKLYPCVEARLLFRIARRGKTSQKNLELFVASILANERIALDRFLSILGTLGNSAPFIGLFGTVLGIIKAFAELGNAMNDSGMTEISGGLAEALVTTAAGLLVAIPCAIAFNYFQRKIKVISSRCVSLSSLILGSLNEF